MISLLNHNPLRSVGIDEYIYRNSFVTAGSSDPSVQGDDDGETVLEHSATGTFTYTFPSGREPLDGLYCAASIRGDEPDLSAKADYDASTGVLTVYVYENDAGAIALADTTGVTVQVFCVFTRSGQGNP